jgi:superfamily I DNA/RNA helicase
LAKIQIFADAEREIAGVTEWIKQAVDAGIAPSEIGIFVRFNEQLARARAAVKAAGQRLDPPR